MDGGAWWATVHRVAKSRTRLSNFTSLQNVLEDYLLDFFPSNISHPQSPKYEEISQMALCIAWM